MYDELVKRLRNEAESPDNYPEDSTIMRESADAIESTSKAYQMMAEAYESEVTKHGWIPVTQRLPEDGSDVLAYLKCADNSRIAAANYYKGTWQDCIMGRLYLTEEGFVTHWMPLPELPEEER